MNAHVLLHLLNNLGNRDKMPDFLSILAFFPTSLINSIIQGTQMFDSFLSYDPKTTLQSCFWCEMLRLCHIYVTL